MLSTTEKDLYYSIDEVKDKTGLSKILRKNKDKLFPEASFIAVREVELVRTFRGEAFYDASIRYKKHIVKFIVDVYGKDDEVNAYTLYGDAGSDGTKCVTFEILKYLADKMTGSSKLKVMQPVGYIEDYDLLITAEAPGESMRYLIQREGASDLTKHYFKAAGIWLAQLHSLDPAPIDDACSLRKSLKTISKTASKETQPDYLNAPDFEKIVGVSVQEFEALQSKIWDRIDALKIDQPVVIAHGDFQTENMLVDNKRITVIDFDWTGLRDRFVDLAFFWTQTELMFHNVLSGAEIATLRGIFWYNYWGEDKTLPKDQEMLFNAYQAQSYLNYIAHIMHERIAGTISAEIYVTSAFDKARDLANEAQA